MREADTALRALRSLDLTELGDECRPPAVTALLHRALTPHGPVAAVCLWPQYVAQAHDALKTTNVRIATVVNFPAGGTNVERAVEDAREALTDGATEIDLVIPWRALLAGDPQPMREMIEAVVEEIAPRARLKAILETGALVTPELIRSASEISIAAGAHFLKTSTGKTPVSATPEAARVMLNVIRAAGKPVGFKASGGIRTLADAGLYLGLADEIMGPNWASPATFRIGASSLLDALLAALEAAPGPSAG